MPTDPPLEIHHYTTSAPEMPANLTQDLMTMVFDPELAMKCSDNRILKILIRILRAGFAEACEQIGTRENRSRQDVEISYVVAGCQRIQNEKLMIKTPVMHIHNPLSE